MTDTDRLRGLIEQAQALTAALRRSATEPNTALESVQDYGAALAEVLSLARAACTHHHPAHLEATP